MTLREVFRRAKQRQLPEAWLYLPADTEWTVDTIGEFIDWENEEKDADEIPLVAKEKNLHETLDHGTIEQVVDWADRLTGGHDDAARLDIFRYYFKFDAFPDRLGAPDPPPAHEIIQRLDREFYDSLGDERTGTKCRHEGCNRGTVRFSVFCKTHHFEQIKRKLCPFAD